MLYKLSKRRLFFHPENGVCLCSDLSGRAYGYVYLTYTFV